MNYTTMPGKDLVLHARWQESYKITFDAVGGYLEKYYFYLPPNANFGIYGNLPVPTREGHTFKGWYTKKEGGTKIDESTIFSEEGDTTIYAHWEVNQYVIAFNTNGGSSVPSMYLDYGSIISLPTNIEKGGFVFDGWYLDSGLIYPMNMTKMPAYDFTLYAKWKEAVQERDALDYIDVIFGAIVGGVLAILAAGYTVMACCCSICAKNSRCGRYNLFTKCECGRQILGKMMRDSGMDEDVELPQRNNSSGNQAQGNAQGNTQGGSASGSAHASSAGSHSQGSSAGGNTPGGNNAQGGNTPSGGAAPAPAPAAAAATAASGNGSAQQAGSASGSQNGGSNHGSSHHSHHSNASASNSASNSGSANGSAK